MAKELTGDTANGAAPIGRPLSKADYVFQRLRQDLSSGSIRPGAQIRQGELSIRYGVSATPVREALRRLEAEGLIDYSPHHGATVNEMPQADLYALYRFRAEVEKLLVELAVERSDSEAIAKVHIKHEELSAKAEAGGTAEELSQLNQEFHLALMRAGSAYIADRVIRPLWERVIPTSQSQWDNPDHVKTFLREHEEILRELDADNAKKAGQLMADHVHGAFKERQARNRGD